MDVSVITVTWNSADMIEAQLQSVRNAAEGVSFEHIVVDNASTDATVEKIEQSGFPIQLYTQTKNLGFAGGNNIGFSHATGRYIFFLNPDMALLPGTLQKAVQFMDAHPNAAISSGVLKDKDGHSSLLLRPRLFPRRRDQVMIFFKLHRLFPKAMKMYTGETLDLTHEQKVDSVRGSCMIVRRSFLDTLGFAFDPRYFIWYEDVDLCREAYARGYEVWLTSAFSASDFAGRSFAKRRLYWKQKQFTKSMVGYEKKWGHPFFALFLSVCRIPLLVLAWLHDVLGFRSRPSQI